MLFNRELHSAVSEYADSMEVSRLTRFAMHVFAIRSPSFADDVMINHRAESRLRDAREAVYRVLLKTEDDMSWVIGLHHEGEDKTTPVNVSIKSDNEFGRKQHFIVDRGTQDERISFLNKVSAQIKVYRDYAKRHFIGDPDDAELQVSRAYMKMVRNQLAVHREGVADLDALRRKMLKACAYDEGAPLPPKYVYLFIYDYDEVMGMLTDKGRDRFMELVKGGDRFGIRLIISTGGEPDEVPGHEQMNSVIIANGPDSVGDDTAFVEIDGEIKTIDIF